MKAQLSLILLASCVATPIDSGEEDPIDIDDGQADAKPLRLSDSPRGEFDIEDAEALARLSDLAYKEPAEMTARVRAIAPGARVSWFFGATTEAYYVELGTAGVLVFRGTSTRADLDTDLASDMVPWTFGKLHRGFKTALDEIWLEQPRDHGGEAFDGEVLRDFLAARHSGPPDHPLFITGHSLGGALATIAYVRAELDGCEGFPAADPRDCGIEWSIPVHALYTFGSPRPGDPAFGRLAGSPLMHEGRPVFRFVHRGDIVPHVPERSAGYSHAMIAKDGDLLIHINRGNISFGKNLGTFVPSVGDHSIALYIDAIRRVRR